MRELLEEAGFTDIEEISDGKFNATRNGTRYFGLYPISCGTPVVSETEDAVTIPVTMSYKEVSL